MKTIIIDDGFMSFAESIAKCKFCTEVYPFDKIEKRFDKTDKDIIKMKCTCGKMNNITIDYKGDYIALNKEGGIVE